MATAITALKPLDRHKRWTKQDCAAMERAGIIQPESYELIEGELLLKVPKHSPHGRAIAYLSAALRHEFGVDFVMTETSIDLRPEDSPASTPEPDVILVNVSLGELPPLILPSQIRFLAEVSYSTLDLDLEVKSNLYARSGLPEYWVLDVVKKEVHVHRKPLNGQYKSITTYAGDEQVSLLAAPDYTFPVSELF